MAAGGGSCADSCRGVGGGWVVVVLLLVVFAEDVHIGVHIGIGNMHGGFCIVRNAFCLRWDSVVVFRNELVFVTNGLEEHVDAMCGFDVPEDLAMLEPGVGEDAVDATEDVGELAHALEDIAAFSAELESGREVFAGCEDVGCPVEGVVDVVDCTAGFGRFVHGAEILPL